MNLTIVPAKAGKKYGAGGYSGALGTFSQAQLATLLVQGLKSNDKGILSAFQGPLPTLAELTGQVTDAKIAAVGSQPGQMTLNG